MIQTLLKIVVMSMFLLLDGTLRLLGYEYFGTAGSAIEKIHPSLFFMALLIGLTFALPANTKFEVDPWLKGAYRLPLLIILPATIVTVLLARPMTGDSAAVIVTYLGPVMLAYCLQFASRRTANFITGFVPLFFIVNSCIGIIENVTGWRLLPYYVGGMMIEFDTRPTAIIGHPLTNALLTGMIFLLTVARLVNVRMTYKGMAIAGLHLAAMLSFGGRASMAMTFVLAFLIILSHTGIAGRVRYHTFLRSFSILLVAGLAIPLLLSSGISDRLLDRFENANSSSATRFVAFDMPQYLNTKEWWIGTGAAKRAAIRTVLDTPWGIEVAPLAMLQAYGLPMTLGLLGAAYYLFFRFSRGRIPGATAMTLLFIVSTWTALSIGSKSMLISEALLILYTARKLDERDPVKAAPRPRRAGALPMRPKLNV